MNGKKKTAQPRRHHGISVAQLFLFCMACLAMTACAPFVGMKTISPLVLVQDLAGTAEDPEAAAYAAGVFWRIRLPRVLLAFLAGASLSVSGMAFQALFRNPLATPFTLGTSSGASLGAAIYLIFSFNWTLLGIPGQSVCAFLGAVLAIVLVYSITQLNRQCSTAMLLLAGVAASFFFSSLILFLQYMSDFTDLFRIIRYFMGNLQTTGYGDVLNVFFFTAAGTLILLSVTHELNLLATGEELARGRGVDTAKMRNLLFFATSLLVGAVVAFCGPIGFVGMMAPHMCRLVTGPDHRLLFPASFVAGGTFLVLCDTAGKLVNAPAEVPAGVITALFGGPFFLWLLIGKSSPRGMIW